MAQTNSSITKALRPFIERGCLAGAVALVADKDRILSTDEVGYSDIASQTPMRQDALFWIASTTKPITGAAAMMLVDEGKLDVNDPVEKYLPEFKGQMLCAWRDGTHQLLVMPERPITVRDVLSHTSGLPFMSRVEQVIDARPLREAVVSYALTPLGRQPGTNYEYSNAGINIAGRIIEVLARMPYEQFVQQHLFEPLGMSSTTFFPTSEQVKRIAKSYRPNVDKSAIEETPITQFTYALDRRDRYACPAGGLFSTAADVARFGQMILNGGTLAGRRYLSEEAVRQMTSTQTGALLSRDGNESGYGYGWSTSRKYVPTGPVPAGECGHGGAYSNQFCTIPERQLVLVFMVQHAGWIGDGGKAYEAFRSAAVQTYGKRSGLPGAKRYHVYVGTYTNPENKGIHLLNFDTDTGRLEYRALAAESPNPTFLCKHPQLPVLYAANEQYGPAGGAVSAFYMQTDGSLAQTSQQPSKGTGPCHVSVDSTGSCLMVANYGSGSFASLPVGAEGQLAPAATTVQHSGKGGHLKRQEGPHAHAIYPDPSNRFAFAVDLGTDEICVYRMDAATATLSLPSPMTSAKSSSGAGPRHLVFSRDSRFVYVVNELDSTVSAYAWNADAPSLKHLQTLSTLHEDFKEHNSTAEIDLHPNGRTLYVSNRGHDSIAAFRVTMDTGLLAPLAYQSSEGGEPRHFAIDPTGRWMLVCNQKGNSVVVLRIEESGELRCTGRRISVPAAVCALFVPA